MADHDPLEASQWDDVLSSNPTTFSALDKSIVNELSATFAETAVNDKKNDDNDIQHTEADESVNEEQIEESTHETSTSSDPLNSNSSVEHQPKSPPPKDTSELFSTLTHDDGFKKESIKSPKKDESLFNENLKSHSNLPTAELNFDDKKDKTVTSPNRLRRQNVYRAPRLRRNTVKKDTSLNTDTVTDPLGPLGSNEDDEHNEETKVELNPAETLLKESEAPLFDINRTPLSPIKFKDNDSKKQDKLATEDLVPYEPTSELHITVGDPTKVGDLTSAHIVYSVHTTTDTDILNNKDTVVSRRYRDFRWLFRQLQQTHPGRIIPPPPEKQAVGRFNQDFIEGRRFALERMLVKISQSPILQKDPDFIMFLQSDRFSSEAREHEKALGTNSTFTENDYNDASLNNSGGFLSSIGGAFSFTPKVIEPDDYFKDKKSYIESLDQEFKAFSRNLEVVVIQRQDLSVVTEEFSNIISTLADLEVSKISNELFQEFSNTQIKIKDLLDRLSLQDMLTLGYTLDEYQRLILSIKDTFDQRDKLLLLLAKSETDLKKKQSSYDKNFKYNRTQTDKLDLIKNELSTLETKNQSIKEKFISISKVIIEELKAFEFEKIHDFRNSIEIFLESTIESQKEAVELWESFYNNNLSTDEQNTTA